jgi:hypothetical protein
VREVVCAPPGDLSTICHPSDRRLLKPVLPGFTLERREDGVVP